MRDLGIGVGGFQPEQVPNGSGFEIEKVNKPLTGKKLLDAVERSKWKMEQAGIPMPPPAQDYPLGQTTSPEGERRQKSRGIGISSA